MFHPSYSTMLANPPQKKPPKRVILTLCPTAVRSSPFMLFLGKAEHLLDLLEQIINVNYLPR